MLSAVWKVRHLSCTGVLSSTCKFFSFIIFFLGFLSLFLSSILCWRFFFFPFLSLFRNFFLAWHVSWHKGIEQNSCNKNILMERLRAKYIIANKRHNSLICWERRFLRRWHNVDKKIVTFSLIFFFSIQFNSKETKDIYIYIYIYINN